jgi:protein phosphatase
MIFGRKTNGRKPGESFDSNSQKSHEIVASLQTDPGCVREVNEDTGRFIAPNDFELLVSKGILLVVADGMGGHSAGEVASRIAVDMVCRIYYESKENPTDSLKKALTEANRKIYETSLADEKLNGMGTTCTALVLHQSQAFAAHVGDSRLYLLRATELYLMTEDHSAVMELVKRGVITMDEARHHEDKNVIFRALGTSPTVEVFVWANPLSVKVDDQFILCSDGLYDLVEDAEIRTLTLGASDPQSACESLIDLAKRRGGHDNITVGVVRIVPPGSGNSTNVRETRELEVAL